MGVDELVGGDKQMGEAEQSRRKMLLLMFLVPLFWGGAFDVSKQVVSELPPFTAATMRFGLAGLLLVLWCTWRGEWKWPEIRKRWWSLLIVAVTGIFGYNACFFVGLQGTSATNGALEIAITPVTIPLLAVVFLGETWSKRLGWGMSLSVVGVLTVMSHGSWSVLRSLSFNAGDLYLLGAVLCFTVYSLVGKVVMREVSPLLSTTVATVIGAMLLGFCSLFEQGWQRVPHLSGQAVGGIVYLACFASTAAFVIWNMGVQQIGASVASAYENLIPIHTAWMAVVFYGEQVSAVQRIGMVLVIGGVLVTTWTPRNTRKGKAKEQAGAGQQS